MTTHSETYIDTRTRRGHTSSDEVIVKCEPGELTEEHKASGWYAAIDGDNTITAVRKVTISRAMVFGGRAPKHNPDHVSTYTEIETAFGRACVVNFRDGSQLSGFVSNDGKSLNMGTWSKYGMKRGHGVAWMMVQKKRPNGKRRVARNSQNACPAEVYSRLVTGGWGDGFDYGPIHDRSEAWRKAKALDNARKLVAEADAKSA